VLQDEAGQIAMTHSVSAGLDYPSIGPEQRGCGTRGGGICGGYGRGSAECGFDFGGKEGIIPALESAHAVAEVVKRAPSMKRSQVVVVNVSGRGIRILGFCGRIEAGVKLLERAGEGACPHVSAGEDGMRLQFTKRPGLVVYVTCGDPSMAVTRDVVLDAIDAGADVIELGVPFSDPVADGPVIQRPVRELWSMEQRWATC